MANQVTGAILAGGLSTRMGSDKATVQLAGRSLVEWVASSLRPVCSEILLVGGSIPAPEGFRVTPDAHPQRCSLTGLYTALAAARLPLVLVVACDYPLVGQRLLERLVRTWVPGLLGLVPLGPEGPHPLLALYHRDLAPRLRVSLDAGRFKISRAVDPRRQAYLPWASLERLGVRAEELWNLNTPHELDRARRFLEGVKRMDPKIKTALLTISDRSSRGQRADESGQVLAGGLDPDVFSVEAQQVLPDEQDQISSALRGLCVAGFELVLTTGGTGFSPRDVTPEATRAVIEREAPGLAEAMRAASMQRFPHAMLSRSVAGICGRTLIVNLPGSPKAVRENLAVILPALPHGIELLRGEPAPHPSA